MGKDDPESARSCSSLRGQSHRGGPCPTILVPLLLAAVPARQTLLFLVVHAALAAEGPPPLPANLKHAQDFAALTAGHVRLPAISIQTQQIQERAMLRCTLSRPFARMGFPAS